ncbi:unnamed protein product [Penicillium roqueforti FM164]|uniref:Genomic scaffold, ProqFM164S01 n=1 Tax=Penicillium roqueforti (strain FM164) TaxID=1365484 RepID=W6QHM2_PENRF|nr:unnamed protein product [Penicillium roqueforti FM164]
MALIIACRYTEMTSDHMASTLSLYAESVQETRSERSASSQPGVASFTVFHLALPQLSLNMNMFQPLRHTAVTNLVWPAQ